MQAMPGTPEGGQRHGTACRFGTSQPGRERAAAYMLLGSPSGEGGRVAMVLSRAADVAGRPDLLDKVIALGGGWRDEPVPAPSRAELLSIAAGD